MNWSQLKKKGNKDYKAGRLEPIDLLKSGGVLWNFALGNIIKYAYRNINLTISDGWFQSGLDVKEIHSDLDKIIHYAEMLKVVLNEAQPKTKE